MCLFVSGFQFGDVTFIPPKEDQIPEAEQKHKLVPHVKKNSLKSAFFQRYECKDSIFGIVKLHKKSGESCLLGCYDTVHALRRYMS